MLAALIAAAGSIEKHSKTPFYILAAVLVVAAVGLTAFGLRRHGSFPGSDGAMRATIALFLLLVAGVMITAVATA